MNKYIEYTLVVIALTSAVVGIASLYYLIWVDPMLGGQVFASSVITFLVAGYIASNI